MKDVRKRRWVTYVACCVLTFIGTLMWFAFRRSPSVNDLELLRQHGAPTTYEELAAMQPRNGADGGPLYQEAHAILEQQNIRPKLEAMWQEELKPSASQAERDDLKALSKAEELCVKAVKMPRVVGAPGDEFHGYREQNQSFQWFYEFSSIFKSRFRVDAADGNLEKAFDDLANMRGLAIQASNAHGTMSYMESTVEYIQASTQWNELVNVHQDNRSVLLTAQKWANVELPVPSLRAALASDLPGALEGAKYYLAHFDEFLAEHRTPRSKLPAAFANPIAVRLANQQYIHAFRLTYERLPKDDSDWQGIAKVCDEADSHLPEPANAIMKQPFQLYGMIAADLPIRTACQRVAKQSAAILLYRLDHGSLPATLPLSGDDAIDPFTGKQLIYRPLGKGFEVFSLGQDKVENHAPRHGNGLGLWDPGMQFD